MRSNHYNWRDAVLEEHSRCKHTILKEYFRDYIIVRCQNPHQGVFRLAICDGFSGGGRYNCGGMGSPLIFIEVLQNVLKEINLNRLLASSPKQLRIECLLLLNDADKEAVNILEENIVPLQTFIQKNEPNLYLQIKYSNQQFEDYFMQSKLFLERGNFQNVLFNLDPYGHSHVKRSTISTIMRSYKNAEIFYTFPIKSLIAYLTHNNPKMLEKQLAAQEIDSSELKQLEELLSKREWLAAAERIVFNHFQYCAPFVSPFSIHNPAGWRYWLLHFANSYRARQVYNVVLHHNSGHQAHLGPAGIYMLRNDTTYHTQTPYLFDETNRSKSYLELIDDIPRFVSDYGDAMEVGNFYRDVYNSTPAHFDDINQAIIDNPDLIVFTKSGGKRRKAHTIGVDDIITINNQKSFFPVFRNPKNPKI